MKKTVPAISIITAMYNTEKYVAECLDSILAQTFKDYEVIIVDDCSTDNSCAIVESYIPKFKGRLQLIRSKKNSGGCAIPRNIGMRFACGKYIYFMDSDDAITPNALEKIYNLAEKFNVDIVHCEKWYEVPEEPIKIDKKLFKENSWQQGSFVDNPTLMTDDLAERVKLFVEKKFCWMAWTNLINREYLVKKNINFYDLRVSEDVLFTFNMLCTNSKVIRVPNIFYIWRTRKDSQYRAVLPVEKRIHRRIRDVFLAITYLDKFMEDINFFIENPNARYAVLEFYKNLQSYDVLPIYAQIPAWQLDHLIRRELDEVKYKTALTAFLFARMNILNVKLAQAINLLIQQPKEVQDFQRQQIQLQQLQQKCLQLENQLEELQKTPTQIRGDTLKKNIPAVSIIIPMYNVEKYIAECLDSILEQTFKDYEVIAVDDCSKDKTCEIVESYIPKFKGKLQLIRSEKNSGGAGTPRNIGIGLSVGEYIFLMDSDDAIIPTAFAELYPIAKKFDADVVHCEKYFLAPGETVSTDKKILKETSFESWTSENDFVKKPTVYTNSLLERVKHFSEHKICWMPWSHIIRRSLIAKYDIKFTNLRIHDDMMFSFCVTLRAANFVRVPNIIYTWRTLVKSNSRGE